MWLWACDPFLWPATGIEEVDFLAQWRGQGLTDILLAPGWVT